MLYSRLTKKKKGYEVDKFVPYVIKMCLISAVLLAFTIRLAQHKRIPMVLVWIVVIVIVYAYISQKTTIDRHFYDVGGNEKANILYGINANRVYVKAYTNVAFLAAIAGMITIARLNAANPTAGTSYEMDAIGACFIGGASAYGGIGTIPGVIIGATLKIGRASCRERVLRLV